MRVEGRSVSAVRAGRLMNHTYGVQSYTHRKKEEKSLKRIYFSNANIPNGAGPINEGAVLLCPTGKVTKSRLPHSVHTPP